MLKAAPFTLTTGEVHGATMEAIPRISLQQARERDCERKEYIGGDSMHAMRMQTRQNSLAVMCQIVFCDKLGTEGYQF